MAHNRLIYSNYLNRKKLRFIASKLKGLGAFDLIHIMVKEEGELPTRDNVAKLDNNNYF